MFWLAGRIAVTQARWGPHFLTNALVYYSNSGVGKLFSQRAALTISRVVQGQGLSRTAACYRRNCISSQFCEIFWQCGISTRKIGGVSKKKGLHLFVDGNCLTHFLSKVEAIAIFLRTPSLLRLSIPLSYLFPNGKVSKSVRGPHRMLSRAACGPRAVVCPPLHYTIKIKKGVTYAALCICQY